MIAWQNAALLWALPVAAAPLLIHLLRRHVAERAPFPSLRFVTASQSAAVRLLRPSDLLLLLLRTLTLLAAVLAVAGPVVLTQSRVERWNLDIARAVVVDVSDSMRLPGADGRTPEHAAADAIEAETGTATYSHRIEAADVAAGIKRAEAWLRTAPPARREIVVVSDFQQGSVRLLGDLNPAVGLRLVQAGRLVSSRRIQGAGLLGAGSVAPRSQTIELAGDSTAVVFGALERTPEPSGLRIVPDGAAAERLKNIVAAAGTPAGSPDEPILIRFDSGGLTVSPPRAVANGWMLRTLWRVQRELAGNGSHGVDAVRAVGEGLPWNVVERDRQGRALVAGAAAGDELVLDVAAAPDSFLAASVVRAVLAARRAPLDNREQEISRLPETTRAAMSRAAGRFELRTAHPDLWRHVPSTDTRWCWAAVLMLLAIEQWLRRRSRRGEQETVRAAA